MIELFIKRPVSTIVIILIFMVMGITSYFNIIQERTPKVDFPIVTIKLVYPGASPIEIESQLVKKVENAVAVVSDIEKIESNVYESFALVMVQFKLHANVNEKAIEIKDKIEPLITDFPSGAEKPVVSKFDILVTSVIDLVLQSNKHTDLELFEHADKTLKHKLSIIPGVASVELAGGRQRQINVIIDNDLLIKNFLTINDVVNSIKLENLNVPGGNIKKTNKKINIRFMGEFTNIEDIKKFKLTTPEGKIVKLSDIANIEDSSKELSSIAKYNGKSVLILSLMKLSDGSAVSIANEIKGRLNKVNESLPEGMNLKIAYDSTKIIVEDNLATILNIFIGVALTTFILLCFLGDWRTAFIASLVIPSSLISSLFLMDLSGFTINIMTLIAFGTALGTLIANALVVIESIYGHLNKGKDSITAAIDGCKEVIVSVFSSAGTNLVVFTPIAFMGGMIGKFFVQFGLTVVYTTLFSILTSLSLTPMLCALLLRPKQERGNSWNILSPIVDLLNATIRKTLQSFKSIYLILVKYPILSIILIIIFFLSIKFPAKYLGFELMSNGDENLIRIKVIMPDGTRIQRTNEIIEKIEMKLEKIDEVESYLSNIGKNGEENAEITVNLIDKEKRKESDLEIIDGMIPYVANIPDAEISVFRGQSKGPGHADLTINVISDNYDELIDLSLKMKQVMQESGYFSKVTSSYKTPKNEIRFIPNKDKLIEQGLNNAIIGSTLRNIVNGNTDSVFKEAGEEYDINVELRDDQKENIGDFEKFVLRGKDGIILLGSLGQIEEARAIPPIKRRDKKRIIQLEGYLLKSTAGVVTGILDKKFETINFPNSAEYKYAGNNEFLDETTREILKAFILAVILTYLLLAGIMNSFLLPFSIASTIFTSMLGSILLMFYFELSINIASMMAFVMLVGLTVNNAILLLDYTLQQMKEGKTFKDALWIGMERKSKTVIMTSIAIIAGTLPQFLDPDPVKSAMGAVIIGGMIGSIFFTYLLIPPTFALVNKIKGVK